MEIGLKRREMKAYRVTGNKCIPKRPFEDPRCWDIIRMDRPIWEIDYDIEMRRNIFRVGVDFSKMIRDTYFYRLIAKVSYMDVQHKWPTQKAADNSNSIDGLKLVR
jgi:hypothetical protein